MSDQQRGQCGTFSVPRVIDDAGTSGTNNAALVYQAAQVPLRLLVRNISPDGMGILLSYDRQSLQPFDDDLNPSRSYTLPAGMSDVFTLMPTEALYTISPNSIVGALLSYAVSVAFPFEVKS